MYELIFNAIFKAIIIRDSETMFGVNKQFHVNNLSRGKCTGGEGGE